MESLAKKTALKIKDCPFFWYLIPCLLFIQYNNTNMWKLKCQTDICIMFKKLFSFSFTLHVDTKWIEINTLFLYPYQKYIHFVTIRQINNVSDNLTWTLPS